MGLSGIGPLELLLVLAIVVMLFGTKRLRHLGGDLGSALKGFRNAMKDGEDDKRDHDKASADNVEYRDTDDDAHHEKGH